MSGVYKRKSDIARGKRGKWSFWYLAADGRRHYGTGTTDKDSTRKVADQREAEARLIREGIVDPSAARQREAALKPAADHVDDYRLDLLAKGDTPKHAAHIASVLRRLLADAAIDHLPDLAADRLQAALGRLRVSRSARTHNHALRAVRAFVGWLGDSGRLRDIPAGLRKLPLANEAADRRLERRSLTAAEFLRLVGSTADRGPDLVVRRAVGRRRSGGTAAVVMSGPHRAAAYILAGGTGFRAAEVRSLTPARFDLDGDAPTVTCLAGYTKNGREAVQPITPQVAAIVRPWVTSTAPGEPVFPLPIRTAEMIRADLALAEIPVADADGKVADFHGLRHRYISEMIAHGVDPKTVQVLARHSTITLTIDRYSHTDERRKRDALGRDESA